ncbi:hypothetical protein LTS08_008056 [Lithohypha guttulata]|nr:hypothetical protein LTS08_008056 [Lithohypha guttulata]
MSRFEIELVKENERLKREVATMFDERNCQQSAYRTFIAQAEKLNQQLPHGTMHDQYFEAYQNLIRCSNVHVEAQKKRADEGQQEMSDLKVRLMQILLWLRAVYQNLQPAKVAQDPNSHRSQLMAQDQLNMAITDLQQNLHSHAAMVVIYMDQRHQFLSAGLRAEIGNLLGPYFCEASDLRQLTSKISAAVESGLKLDEAEVRGLSPDLQKSLADAVGALASILDEVAGHVADQEGT